MGKTIIFLIMVAFAAMGASSEDTQDRPGVAEVLHFGSRPLQWRPDWPTALPPDAFLLRGGRVPRTAAVTLEAAGDADSAAYSAAWTRSGAPLHRPLFLQGAAYSVNYAYDSAGRLLSYGIAPLDGGAKAGNGGVSPEYTVFPAFGPDGSLASAELAAEGQRVTLSFVREGETLEELTFGEDGSIEGRVSLRFSGDLLRAVDVYGADGEVRLSVRYEYDAAGRIVRVAADENEADAHYGSGGRPLMLALRLGPEKKETVHRYQWDERGLLVREFIVDPLDEVLEIAFFYTFDARGEWVVRDSIVYRDRFGLRAPEQGTRVVRKLTY